MNFSSPFQLRFFSGISGLQLPIPKSLFPPPFENVSRISYYSFLFNSIEINSSFYKIPGASTFTGWAESTSDNFLFTFKLWKGITHTKVLQLRKEDVFSFFTAINFIGGKKGCLLIQLPPGLGKDCTCQLDKLFSCIKETDTANEWKVATEFRNESWYHNEIFELLKAYNIAMVGHDIPKSRTPFLNSCNGDFIYNRFHGPTGNYRDGYSEDFLNKYAANINGWIEEGKTVFVYFNNTMGDAINNLITLNRLVCGNAGLA